MKPLLSILIISYNTVDITINCLKSIIRDPGLKDIDYEIIVVDNASTDDSVLKINKLKKSLKISNLKFEIIYNSTNLGFAKANNQAFKVSTGNYVLLLNSDTIILHGAISQTLNWLSSHPESAGCTAQLLNSDGTIQPTGGYFPNLLNVLTWSLSFDDLPLINLIIPPLHPHSPTFYTHDSFYLKNQTLDWVTGAYFLTRKNIIDSTQGFDENYFMYAEEIEWIYRIKKLFKNLTINYLVGAQVTHLGGASSPSKVNTISNEYLGIIKFFQKHYSPLSTILVTQLLKVNSLIRTLLYKLINKPQLSSFYAQACSKI